MKIILAYGKNGLPIEAPDDAVILSASQPAALPNERAAILHAIRNPVQSKELRSLVKPGYKVALVHTDITRATPNKVLLPVILEELEIAGVQHTDITLINGLGTHRRQTDAELREMLGDEIVANYRCVQHDAWDDKNLVPFGSTSRGNPVRINRMYAEADIKILTGFIEPHFFAGFSGGPKGVLPSIAGFESVLSNHGYEMIAHPQATWGVTRGNPIWDEMAEVALRTQPTFLVNVTMNDNHQLTGVFAGEMLSAHGAGCGFLSTHTFVEVSNPFDIVVTTNSGYPLDQNLYQSVKGISAAALVVRKGGAIVMCTACNDGLPAHGKYIELLEKGGSPEGVQNMIAEPGFHGHDQWQVQIQAQVQRHADVFVHSDGLTDQEIYRALFTPMHVAEALAKLPARYGRRIGILPNGPQVIPTLK